MFYIYDRHAAENYIAVSPAPIGEFSEPRDGDMQAYIADAVNRYGFDVEVRGNQTILSN